MVQPTSGFDKLYTSIKMLRFHFSCQNRVLMHLNVLLRKTCPALARQECLFSEEMHKQYGVKIPMRNRDMKS